VLWVRLILSLVVGGALGFGAGLVALGLLPTFAPVGGLPPDHAIATDDAMLVRAVTMDPVAQAEKRRFSTALGLGSLCGACAMLTLFIRSRRWCEAPATSGVAAKE
jgi:hypothetical protein